jgi:hypothetical protein
LFVVESQPCRGQCPFHSEPLISVLAYELIVVTKTLLHLASAGKNVGLEIESPSGNAGILGRCENSIEAP